MGMDGSIYLYDKRTFEGSWAKIAQDFNNRKVGNYRDKIIVLDPSLTDAYQICEYLHTKKGGVCSCESPFVYGEAVFFYSGDCMGEEAQELTYSVSGTIPTLLEKELWT